MRFTKVVNNDTPDLNDYYETRDTTIRLCNEVTNDYYESVISCNQPPIKIEKNISIKHNYSSVTKIFHEPYTEGYNKTPSKRKTSIS